MIGWIIVLFVIVFVFYAWKKGIEINLEKRHNLMLWQIIAIFIIGLTIGLWLPW